MPDGSFILSCAVFIRIFDKCCLSLFLTKIPEKETYLLHCTFATTAKPQRTVVYFPRAHGKLFYGNKKYSANFFQ